MSIAAALVAIYLAFSLALGGCSSEKRYKVLSFFFDGVPDPNAPKLTPEEQLALQEQGANGNVPKPAGFTHKPYADNQCNACHENARGSFDDFQKLSSDVCLKCHDKLRDQYPVMHGPVAAAECNICHVPHESSIAHLLRDPAPAVCVQCHQPELLSPVPVEHLDPQKSCLDCHSGHGGPKHGLLKAVALGSPTTKPIATPGERGQAR
jgi:predicted CXXCH cytochrome family protein